MIRPIAKCLLKLPKNLYWLLMVATALTSGCGTSADSDRPPTFPVSGTVTLSGKPVEGAVVTFQPIEGKGSAVGSTDAKGVYSLSTFSSNDGAQVGQYKVSIAKYEVGVTPPSTPSAPGQLGPPGLPEDYAPPAVSGSANRGAGAGPKNLLPPKYASPETSALRATVDKGKNTIDFEMK